MGADRDMSTVADVYIDVMGSSLILENDAI